MQTQLQNKPYSVSVGRTPTNWYDVLDRWIKKQLTNSEKRTYIALACQWPTCACGNMCEIIPRGDTGAPHDFELSTLGHRFYIELSGNRPRKALDILHNIERRSAEVIREINRNETSKT